MDYTAFKTNLRKLIDNRGKLIKDVAYDLDITPSTLSRYLLGLRNPELPYVVKLSQYFNVSIDWLLGLNGDKFDVLPRDIQEVADLYSMASLDDRRVIQAVLKKYRDKSE